MLYSFSHTKYLHFIPKHDFPLNIHDIIWRFFRCHVGYRLLHAMSKIFISNKIQNTKHYYFNSFYNYVSCWTPNNEIVTFNHVIRCFHVSTTFFGTWISLVNSPNVWRMNSCSYWPLHVNKVSLCEKIIYPVLYSDRMRNLD